MEPRACSTYMINPALRLRASISQKEEDVCNEIKAQYVFQELKHLFSLQFFPIWHSFIKTTEGYIIEMLWYRKLEMWNQAKFLAHLTCVAGSAVLHPSSPCNPSTLCPVFDPSPCLHVGTPNPLFDFGWVCFPNNHQRWLMRMELLYLLKDNVTDWADTAMSRDLPCLTMLKTCHCNKETRS